MKALILVLTPVRDREETRKRLKKDYGHDLLRLRGAVRSRGATIPTVVSRNLVFVSNWSPELRYEPGFGNPNDAKDFLRAARAVVNWADERI